MKDIDLRASVDFRSYDYAFVRTNTNRGILGTTRVRDAIHEEDVLQHRSVLLVESLRIVN